jgi:hypothetical protein
VPVPVPYANLSNPQTLNLYAMVSDDPESFADLDGHDGWDVAWGVLNSLASNFVGTQRVENGNSDVTTGQALGDALSVTVGGAVTVTTVAGSVAADVATEGAALVLSPVEAMVATTAANGALQGGKNLLKSSFEKSSSDSSDGRAGKQERLREIGNDDKASSADKGWIKQEENAIDRGKRDTIRNPPGKDLAHQRGREAAKGYDYKHSDLKNRQDHQTQHKYDNYGRKNKERPVPQ